MFKAFSLISSDRGNHHGSGRGGSAGRHLVVACCCRSPPARSRTDDRSCGVLPQLGIMAQENPQPPWLYTARLPRQAITVYHIKRCAVWSDYPGIYIELMALIKNEFHEMT